MKRTAVVISAIGIAILATAGGAAAYAATAGTAPPVCVTHGHGTSAAGNVMLWNWDHVACPSGTYGITLPPGPRGPAGPAGATGPAGPAGPADVVMVKQAPGGTSTTIGTTAVCPADHPTVVGGGGAAIGSQPNWIGIAVSEPVIVNGASHANAWTVQGVPDGAETFTAYAMCAR